MIHCSWTGEFLNALFQSDLHIFLYMNCCIIIKETMVYQTSIPPNALGNLSELPFIFSWCSSFSFIFSHFAALWLLHKINFSSKKMLRCKNWICSTSLNSANLHISEILFLIHFKFIKLSNTSNWCIKICITFNWGFWIIYQHSFQIFITNW